MVLRPKTRKSRSPPDPPTHSHTPTHTNAGWSSPVARQAHNLKVAGSNPAPATRIFLINRICRRRIHRDSGWRRHPFQQKFKGHSHSHGLRGLVINPFRSRRFGVMSRCLLSLFHPLATPSRRNLGWFQAEAGSIFSRLFYFSHFPGGDAVLSFR